MWGLKGPAALLAVLMTIGASAAYAQTVAVTAPGNIPAFGNVTAAISGPTDFRVSSAGAVSVASGTGSTSTTTTANTVTLTCSGGGGGSNPCNTNNVSVRVVPTTTLVGRASAVKNITIAMGTATQVTAPSADGAGVKFVIGPIGRNSSKTFRIGLDLPISGGFGASGAASASYQVQAGFATTYTASGNGAATATTRNGTQIVKNSNLSFGTILPLNGQTGTVSINASNGDWSTTNPSGILLQSGLPTTRAAYTINGEGGQVISVTVPGSFDMNRSGGGTLTVTTTKTIGATVTLPNSTGQSGSTTFGVGGSFPITGPTLGGTYTGTFTVTFNWN